MKPIVRRDNFIIALVISAIIHLLLLILTSQRNFFEMPPKGKEIFTVMLAEKSHQDDSGKTSSAKEAINKQLKEKTPSPKRREPQKAIEPQPQIKKTSITPKQPPAVKKKIITKVKNEAAILKKIHKNTFEKRKISTAKKTEADPPREAPKERVEKVAPPVDSTEEKSISPKEGEGTTSLSNNQDKTNSWGAESSKSYLLKLRDKIKKHFKYPRAAKINGLEGDVSVYFLISDNGTLEDIQVTTSSGHPILDDGVLKAIKKAAPFPPLPKGARLHITTINNIKVAHINMNFQYALEYFTLE